MIWSLIGIFLTIIIVGMLKDTHCKCYEGLEAKKEFDIKIPLWVLIIILFIELIPFLNIVLFAAFIILYIVKSCNEPNRFYDKCLFSLRGEILCRTSFGYNKNFLNIKV